MIFDFRHPVLWRKGWFHKAKNGRILYCTVQYDNIKKYI